ncbi:MAG: thermonuclease family protein [Methylococcaceae bacterium]|nr:thermonuclease family protein [Methylococcaceae bacterium]
MYEYKVSRLYKVVDGDTIEVDIDLGFDIAIHKRVRLAGVDTPESRTKDAYEKKLGLEAKEWLKLQLKDAETLRIKTEKPDSTEKYGRILGWLYIGNEAISINEKMIQQGYAWSYLGEKKVKDFTLLEQRRRNNNTEPEII